MSTENIDLTCNEVILEHVIEPKNAKITSTGDDTTDLEDHEKLQDPSTSSLESANDDDEKPASKRRRSKRRNNSAGYSQDKKKRFEAKNDSGEIVERINETPKKSEDPLHKVLPVEIRWMVMKKLYDSELLGLRVISKKWKATIDSILKVNAKIDGSQSEFKGQCGLSMKSCKLISVQDPGHRTLFKPSSCPEEVHVLRGICQVNFKELITSWRFLKKLEICWRSTMKNMLCDKRSISNLRKDVFPCLKSLKIEALTCDSIGKTTATRIISNLCNITSFYYPALSKFQIVFVGYRELHAQNRYLSIILPFIQKLANSLHSVAFSLKYASQAAYPPVHPRHILFCVPANFRYNHKSPYGATDGHLVTTQLERSPNGSIEEFKEWKDMLNDTRKLEVAITTRFVSWSIRHLEFFMPTISLYSKFLRCIDLMNLTMYNSGSHNTVTQVDVKIFGQCIHLRELRLYRAPIIFHEDEVEPSAELINLDQLPQSLKVLNVDGLPVSSNDLLNTIKDLTGLTTFLYFQSQVPRRNVLQTNGVNWTVMEALMGHKNLNFVHVHASSLAEDGTGIRIMYDGFIKYNAGLYGWNTNGITTGYMNMHEVKLTKGSSFLN